MKRILIIAVLPLSFLSLSYGQSEKEKIFEAFDNLVGSTWAFEGQWPSGTKFKQEYKFEWSLNKQLVKVQTFGTINMETNEHGLRNEGIRTWDNSSNEMQFWEFDVFGGITTGRCLVNGKDIVYEYEYEIEGKMELFNDVWKYVDANTYEYSVKMKTEEGWKEFTRNTLNRIE